MRFDYKMQDCDRDRTEDQHGGHRHARRGGGHPRGRGAGHGWGPGAGGGPDMWSGGPRDDFRPGARGRGGRAPGRGRRGDVRSAILALLAEEPTNGYGVINAIAEKSDGLWRPSAGSIYPALGLLEDEGLIAPDDSGEKKTYHLTDEGMAYVSEHSVELDSPWDRVAEPHRGFLDVRSDMQQLAMAVQQVVVTGDEAQLSATREFLQETRKEIYRLLAE